jgi:copper chaperone CopZ
MMNFKPRKPMQFVQIKHISEEANLNTVTYTIPNISCMHCVRTIKNEIGDLEGVKSVEANAESKQATIVFEPPASEAQIVELLQEINYPPAQ